MAGFFMGASWGCGSRKNGRWRLPSLREQLSIQ
jgi:hypothetical protein